MMKPYGSTVRELLRPSLSRYLKRTLRDERSADESNAKARSPRLSSETSERRKATGVAASTRARAPRPALPTIFSATPSIDAPIVPPMLAPSDRSATKPKSSPLLRSSRLRL